MTNSWKHEAEELADEVLRIRWAFDSNDSRRAELSALADRIRGLAAPHGSAPTEALAAVLRDAGWDMAHTWVPDDVAPFVRRVLAAANDRAIGWQRIAEEHGTAKDAAMAALHDLRADMERGPEEPGGSHILRSVDRAWTKEREELKDALRVRGDRLGEVLAENASLRAALAKGQP